MTTLANGNRVLRALTNDKRVLLPGSDHGVWEGGEQELEDVNDIGGGPGLHQVVPLVPECPARSSPPGPASCSCPAGPD